MKGIVLAGGLATRLHPTTKVTNKHLLDVYDEPMIAYPIRTLIQAGISEIVVVSVEEVVGTFKELIGEMGFDAVFEFRTQARGDLGIADALLRAQDTCEGSRTIVILGDNIFQEDLSPFVEAFREQPSGAKILLKRVGREDSHRFGIAEVAGDHIVGIEEKPATPKSDFAVTGCYMYDENVFRYCQALEPSARGELEITDVNNNYVRRASMTYNILRGWWP